MKEPIRDAALCAIAVCFLIHAGAYLTELRGINQSLATIAAQIEEPTPDEIEDARQSIYRPAE